MAAVVFLCPSCPLPRQPPGSIKLFRLDIKQKKNLENLIGSSSSQAPAGFSSRSATPEVRNTPGFKQTKNKQFFCVRIYLKVWIFFFVRPSFV